MRILIVEDDERSAEWLCETFKEAFPSSEHEVISTESSFFAALPSILDSPPDLAVVDIMLRWADVSEESLSAPEENVTGGPFRAGFRIIEALQSQKTTKALPVVLYSSVHPEGIAGKTGKLPENVVYLRKDTDPRQLLSVVRSLLSTSPRTKEMLAQSKESLGMQDKTKIFVSYSHKDRQWLEELQITLKPYVRDEEFLLWDDNQILPGTKWKAEIEKSLHSGTVAILLVSRYFFASDFIAKNELPPLLELAERRGVKILWIAVSWSSYERSAIVEYQALNDPSRPLDSLQPSDLSRQLVDIAKRIHQIALLPTR